MLFFLPRGRRGRVKQAVADAILNGENFDFESRLVTAKGNLRWVRAIGSVQYRDGKPVGVRGMQQDVTDRKMAEEEQARLQVQLAQVQKLDSIGRLAGGVAHDFNNMLGVILGHAEMALQDIDENNPLRSDIKGIMQAAEHSAELTRQLLAFARKQTIAPRVVDLNQTVASMLSMIKRIIGENIDLEWIPTDQMFCQDRSVTGRPDSGKSLHQCPMQSNEQGESRSKRKPFHLMKSTVNSRKESGRGTMSNCRSVTMDAEWTGKFGEGFEPFLQQRNWVAGQDSAGDRIRHSQANRADQYLTFGSGNNGQDVSSGIGMIRCRTCRVILLIPGAAVSGACSWWKTPGSISR